MNRFFLEIKCPLGAMAGIMNERGVTDLFFSKVRGEKLLAAVKSRYGQLEGSDSDPYGLQAQLDEYFAKSRTQFEIPLDLHGTNFQLAVWRSLLLIPFGTTVCYSDIAAWMGQPRSGRAVGNAVGANPIGIIVPCHRVITKDGAIGGYTGGLEYKRFLLDLEGIRLSK